MLSAGLRCEGVSYLDEPNNPNATLVIRDKTHVTQTGDATVEYTDTKGKLRWAHICEVTRKGDTGAVVGVVRFGHPLKKKPTIVAAMLPQAEHPNPFHHRVKYMSKTFHVHVREDDK